MIPYKQFIASGRSTHGRCYGYSQVPKRDLNAKEKVHITCKTHGVFEQEVRTHLHRGCPRCGWDERGRVQRELSVKKFFLECKKLHGSKFDYSEVVFDRCGEHVKITCVEHQVSFYQTTTQHLRTFGACPECISQRVRNRVSETYNTESFVKSAKAKHGNRFDYSLTEYKGVDEKITVICRKHGKIVQTPYVHLKSKSGCARCGKAHYTNDSYILSAVAVHGKKYDYSKVRYVSSKVPIDVVCKTHGVFSINPSTHLRGSGCPQCEEDARTEEYTKKFVTEAKKIHGDTYDYSKCWRIKWNTPLEIICARHGSFIQDPGVHLRGSGCTKCNFARAYSKVSIRWIEQEAKRRRLKNVQHALNGGEFLVPGTNIRVDGYHARSRTIFEFHGDAFHGNPALYARNSKPNPYSDKTAAQLYRATMSRERQLRALGYNVVTVWESDFKDGLK